MSSCEFAVILHLSENNETQLPKNIQIPNFMTICPVAAESFHVDGWTDMEKLAVTFHNFANMLKIGNATATTSHEKYMKYISFPWLSVVAAHHTRLAQALQVNGSTKTCLILRIQLCQSDPVSPLKLCIRRFLIKIAFPMTSIRPRDRCLNVLEYTNHFLLFTTAKSKWHFLNSLHMTMSLLQLLNGINNV